MSPSDGIETIQLKQIVNLMLIFIIQQSFASEMSYGVLRIY